MFSNCVRHSSNHRQHQFRIHATNEIDSLLIRTFENGFFIFRFFCRLHFCWCVKRCSNFNELLLRLIMIFSFHSSSLPISVSVCMWRETHNWPQHTKNAEILLPENKMMMIVSMFATNETIIIIINWWNDWRRDANQARCQLREW